MKDVGNLLAGVWNLLARAAATGGGAERMQGAIFMNGANAQAQGALAQDMVTNPDRYASTVGEPFQLKTPA